MKTYIKPIAEVKEFGLSAAIADLGEYLGSAEAKSLGLGGITEGAIASYTASSVQQ